MLVVSNTDTKALKVMLSITGMPMDEPSARKLANELANDFLRWRLGLNMEADIAVTVAVDPTPVMEMEDDEPTIDPETPSGPVKATAEEIAAMSPADYRAAKAAGRI